MKRLNPCLTWSKLCRNCGCGEAQSLSAVRSSSDCVQLPRRRHNCTPGRSSSLRSYCDDLALPPQVTVTKVLSKHTVASLVYCTVSTNHMSKETVRLQCVSGDAAAVAATATTAPATVHQQPSLTVGAWLCCVVLYLRISVKNIEQISRWALAPRQQDSRFPSHAQKALLLEQERCCGCYHSILPLMSKLT